MTTVIARCHPLTTPLNVCCRPAPVRAARCPLSFFLCVCQPPFHITSTSEPHAPTLHPQCARRTSHRRHVDPRPTRRLLDVAERYRSIRQHLPQHAPCNPLCVSATRCRFDKIPICGQFDQRLLDAFNAPCPHVPAPCIVRRCAAQMIHRNLYCRTHDFPPPPLCGRVIITPLIQRRICDAE